MMHRTIVRVAFAATIAAATAVPALADESGRLSDAARIVQDIRKEIPDDYWTRAHCVAVMPDVKKAAFVIGGEYGKGVMSCRSASGWSAPLFMQLAKGSWGFQAGAEQVDLVLLVMNESGVEKLLKNKVSLGADASVAAGPVGRQGSVATDAAMTAEILSYSRSKGLFAGIDLSGGVLRPDDDANRDMYGRGASPRTILASREISAPPEASPFLRALGAGAAANSASGATASVEPRPSDSTGASTAPHATDDDVRAQLVEAQQTLDRMLADTTPSAVGTSGTVGSSGDQSRAGTVTVDRARLMQLRQQIETAIAALNKR